MKRQIWGIGEMWGQRDRDIRYGGHIKMQMKKNMVKYRDRWEDREIGRQKDKDEWKKEEIDRDRVGAGEAEKDDKSRSPGRLHEELQA